MGMPPSPIGGQPDEADDGYFPRGASILRMVHEEKAVGLMYGQRALCVGAVKPLNYVGTSLHTRNKRTPFGASPTPAACSRRSSSAPVQQADRVLAAVDNMHERVLGELPEDAGDHYPAGTPYSAFDPDLMLWTVAVIADSAEWFYDRLVAPPHRRRARSALAGLPALRRALQDAALGGPRHLWRVPRSGTNVSSPAPTSI